MSEWISVEDELPIGQDRLLIYAGGADVLMAVGYFNRVAKCYLVNGEQYPGLCVTHWMPLPDPPKENA